MYKIMTAGPVQVRENVLAARSIPCTNPDQDVEFYEFYKETSMYIIYNNGDIAQLESDVVGLFNKIKGNSFE